MLVKCTRVTHHIPLGPILLPLTVVSGHVFGFRLGVELDFAFVSFGSLPYAMCQLIMYASCNKKKQTHVAYCARGKLS